MEVNISDIEWDAYDGCELPTDIIVAFPYNSDDDLADCIAEWLSDTYGYCPKGFTFTIVK